VSDIEWKTREGGIMYGGDVPVSMEPAEIGDTVRIQTEDHEFDVTVDSIDGNLYEGTVRSIGPMPELEAEGIARGDSVEFSEENIFQIRR
jgi:hypothetical protein